MLKNDIYSLFWPKLFNHKEVLKEDFCVESRHFGLNLNTNLLNLDWNGWWVMTSWSQIISVVKIRFLREYALSGLFTHTHKAVHVASLILYIYIYKISLFRYTYLKYYSIIFIDIVRIICKEFRILLYILYEFW